MILFEKEICDYLSLPSIPIKEWDGKSSFKNGVAVTTINGGGNAYAVCTFDADKDKKVRIVKTFAQEPFYGVTSIFVVPSYMDLNVEEADLDESSKEAAKRLAEEAAELTQNKKEEQSELSSLPEWVFPEIHNKEEAIAWMRQYNSANKIKGRVPENEDTLKMRLINIYSQLKK